MKVEELTRLFELERTYWWFVGTRNVVERAVRRAAPLRRPLDVLDLGAGSGIMLDRVQDLGRTVGTDLSWEAASFCRRKGHAAMAVTAADALPFPAECFDLVILADVLEHCPDDVGVLRELRRILRPGGVLVVSVPAFMALWSHHDIAIGHYRRYRRKGLVSLMEREGFRLRRATYLNSALFPVFLAARLLQRAFRPRSRAPKADYPRVPAPVNRLLVALLNFEMHLLDHISLPAGTSVMIVAHREGAGGKSVDDVGMDC